jgi:hypothetical protein
MSPADSNDELILEGIVTTQSADGTWNIAPMGPRVDREIRRLMLRPFRTSQTYQNLKQHGAGVLHVTDDVLLIARAAVGQLDPPPPFVPAGDTGLLRMADCCRWFAFRVVQLDDTNQRTTIVGDVVERGTVRAFFGFNRAKHAVLEAAILATRIGILPAAEIQAEMKRLAIPVEKTAGEQERLAFRFLTEYVKGQSEGMP